MKNIIFVLNLNDWQDFMEKHPEYHECATYEDTKFALEHNITHILTTSIIHLQNKLIDETQYKIKIYHNNKLIDKKQINVQKYLQNVLNLK